jgi:imidazole glycerol-phosphate synthase subunit HisH
MIAIVDFGMGNLGSVKRKLDLIGIKSVITDSPSVIKDSEKIILPGVGHFGNAMNEIEQRGLKDILNTEVLIYKKPVLGICLGMQLMANHSEEGDVSGLGWIDANVIRFSIRDKLRNKIPHTGWNSIIPKMSSLLLKSIPINSEFYFVHSYHLRCNNFEDILAETIYENNFISAIQRENIFGVQFHPEKSQEAGNQLLKNFVNF